MVLLNCPLCCNETFSSHSSLKYHILGMIDNILCPSCNLRCDNLMGLAEHLEKECKNLPKDSEENENYGSLLARGENMNAKVKEEIEEASESYNSEASRDTSLKQHLETDEIRDDPNMVYTCEMCNMTFASVQQHLEKYHEGEEVLLETEEQEDTAEAQEEDEAFAYNSQTDDDDDMFEDDGSLLDDSSERHNSRTNSMSDDNMTDKEGMHYTRKIKSGNDWVDENQDDNAQDNSSVLPVTTKYIVEEGKVRQISEEEAAEITDQTRIIEIHNCPNCNLQFPNMSHFRKHKCSNAKRVLNNRAEIMERKNQIHKIKEEFRYQCTFCLAIYSSLIALNDHMKSHLVQDESGMVQKKTITMTLHVCDICNTKFPTYKQLRLHSRMHDPVKVKQVDPPVSYNMMGQHNEENTESGNLEREQFECTICEKLYDKEYEEVHMKFHAEQEQFICLVCNRKFDSKNNLNLHTKAHSNNKKFACSYCKKSFHSYVTLEEHVLKQCQKRDFECQYCGRRFRRPHEKVKHERIHTGEKPHVCEICGKSFRVVYCLTLHLRTHTGNRPYTCHHCGKRFKLHGVYTHHMKTHSDDRNYKCSFCPKAFKTAVQLAGHRNSHTKPFPCTECNRPFASLYAVRAHMETHKRDNNLRYKCWICGASYARSFALRDHMNESHGKAPPGTSQDEQALLELENATEETQMESGDGQNSLEESLQENHQMATEEEEYQTTGTADEICQVQILGEAPEGYVQGIESGEAMQENHMEVVEA